MNNYIKASRLPGFPVISAIVWGMAVCGCETRPTDGIRGTEILGIVASPQNQGLMQLEAGVVFFGTETYHCYSLRQLGLESDARISAIDTSCECLTVSVVEYLDALGKPTRGLRFHFADEPHDEASKSSSLATRVTVQLSGGESKEFTVSFLHATHVSSQGAVRRRAASFP